MPKLFPPGPQDTLSVCKLRRAEEGFTEFVLHAKQKGKVKVRVSLYLQ